MTSHLSANPVPRPHGNPEVGKDGGAAGSHVGEIGHGGGDAIPVDAGVVALILISACSLDRF